MDKVYITYFYNIRFFPINLLPVSTAAWDPKWFHNFKGRNEVFMDKRGVMNGLRLETLVCSNIYNADEDCQSCTHDHPESCNFLKKYYDYLCTVNFTAMLNYFKVLPGIVAPGIDNVNICLIVYEKPDNPCSEREPLKKWFKENGVDLVEWSPGMEI